MEFQVGGAREMVYNFLRNHGFMMSRWSDKVWARVDGVTVNVYGAGSMARINDKDGKLLVDAPLAEAVAKVRWTTKEKLWASIETN